MPSFDERYHTTFNTIDLSEPIFTDEQLDKIEEFLDGKDLIYAINKNVKLTNNEKLVLAALLNEANIPLKLKDIAYIVGVSIPAVYKLKKSITKKIKRALQNG